MKKPSRARHRGRRLLRIVLTFGLALLLVGGAFLIGSGLFDTALRKAQNGRYPIGYTEEVERWSAEYGVDPYLVYAVINTESGFNSGAESDAGAIGLMQMTQETFEWLQGKIAPEEPLEFSDLYTPDTSIRFGTYFLSLCLEKYGGDVSTAAAAYHSGWGTVDTLLSDGENTENGVHLSRFPFNQMQHYVNKINKNYDEYKERYQKDAA